MTESTFMEKAREVHLLSGIGTVSKMKCKDAPAKAVILMKRTHEKCFVFTRVVPRTKPRPFPGMGFLFLPKML